MALALSAPSIGVRAQGQSEGIKVQGDWVIEVRRPDGALDSRREFTNAAARSIAGALGMRSLLDRIDQTVAPE